MPKISKKNKESHTVISTKAMTTTDILENVNTLYVNEVDEFIDVKDDNDDEVLYEHQHVTFEEEDDEEEEDEGEDEW